ncbi:MAG: hypothetical protein ACYC5K_01595 [Saccharofermentanales bacterium]
MYTNPRQIYYIIFPGQFVNIFLSKNQNWEAPKLSESFNPDRTILTLSTVEIEKIGDKKSAIKPDSLNNAIIEYLSNNPAAKSYDISSVIKLGLSRTRDY